MASDDRWVASCARIEVNSPNEVSTACAPAGAPPNAATARARVTRTGGRVGYVNGRPGVYCTEFPTRIASALVRPCACTSICTPGAIVQPMPKVGGGPGAASVNAPVWPCTSIGCVLPTGGSTRRAGSSFDKNRRSTTNGGSEPPRSK